MYIPRAPWNGVSSLPVMNVRSMMRPFAETLLTKAFASPLAEPTKLETK